MGIFEGEGGIGSNSAAAGGSVGINDWGELRNDSVLFEDNNLEDFGLGSDFINIPSMPAELETFASSSSQQDIDFNQVTFNGNNVKICIFINFQFVSKYSQQKRK